MLENALSIDISYVLLIKFHGFTWFLANYLSLVDDL